jgi:hypothetical protein
MSIVDFQDKPVFETLHKVSDTDFETPSQKERLI